MVHGLHCFLTVKFKMGNGSHCPPSSVERLPHMVMNHSGCRVVSTLVIVTASFRFYNQNLRHEKSPITVKVVV